MVNLLTARRRSRPTRVRESGVDRVFLIGVYILLVTFLLVVLVPLGYIVASSFSSPAAVSAGRVFLWPVEFTLRGYEVALTNPKILSGFANSLFYTVIGTAMSVVLTVMLAYPLSRADFVGRKVLTGAVVFTMLFAGGMIPTYLVVQAMGMLDTRWAMLIPKAVAVWPAILAITYFRSAIPDEVREAGEIDGASDLRILWKLILPLATPMLAVIALMYAIGQWNSYFDALIYLRDDSLYPLQLVLRNILILNTDSGADAASALERQQLANLLKYSLIVISTVPMMLIYPFVARYFTKGLLLGAVKG
ncbi:MAG TPA: carbohydrate ABC transporter permease [Candidatus Ruania gallistercoris]|uniref:Carbohydrate ABC transporter permease n=1 Tax=Candidatus Ruania gallistercoris TaxID=2838746 RepID=A0A9D2J339_9MICO|nr:carbohydrate ABC transporter permease [Candidatus Ruania gallistercoris]